MANDDAYAFRFEGKEYRLKTLMLSEARAIQKATGKTMGQFDAALQLGDADCLAAIVWVAMKREQPTLQFEDVDGDLMSFDAIVETKDDPAAGVDQGRAEGNEPATPPADQPTPAGP